MVRHKLRKRIVSGFIRTQAYPDGRLSTADRGAADVSGDRVSVRSGRGISAGAIGRKPSKAELKTLDEIGRGPGGLHALRRLLGRAWMVAQGDGHDDITASDIDAAVEQGVAADDAAPARAAE